MKKIYESIILRTEDYTVVDLKKEYIVNIRLIKDGEYKTVADMIARALENSAFARFYPQCSIEYIKECLDENGGEEKSELDSLLCIVR